MSVRTTVSAACDCRRAAREGQAGVVVRQRRRLRELVDYARAGSPLLAERYRDVPEHFSGVDQLPVITNGELMADFDDWVTDRAVRRDRVETFIADPSLIGSDFLGRYIVCTTSGATGTPAILLHDHGALAVYNALGYVRSVSTALLSLPTLWALARGKGRMAAVFVTDGHYLANTMIARRHRMLPWRARSQRLFSALAPLSTLVAELNDFQPVLLSGYPSVLQVLAQEQAAGRLHLRPILVIAAGETLTSTVRQQISAAFGCRVGNYYGTSEAPGLTYECAHQRLHVNTDWYIVEPVDANHQPTPPGQVSDDVLVTNLANRIQPVIRYPLGDRVTVRSAACPCGSPFPEIDVRGRTGDVLRFTGAAGRVVDVSGLAIATVAEQTPGVARCQLVQTGPARLVVRLTVQPTAARGEVEDWIRARLRDHLVGLGVSPVDVEVAAEPPRVHPRSGKFRQVYSEVKA